jgi:hypothetical protein
VELIDEDWLKHFDVKVGMPTATWDKITPYAPPPHCLGSHFAHFGDSSPLLIWTAICTS